MRKRPILLLACMFLLGILLRKTGSWLPLAAALSLFLYTMPWKEKGVRLVLFAAGLPLIFLLGALHMDRALAFRERYLSQIEEGQRVLLVGKVERVEEKTRSFYYYLTDCYIRLSGEQVPCGRVLAYVSTDDYSIGQILLTEGKITLFDTAANEGGFDARSYYRSQRIDFGLAAEEVQIVSEARFGYPQWLQGLRERMQQVLLTSVEDDGVLSAMVLGEKSQLDADVRTLYQKAGISHILAISGLHVSLLGMGLYRLLRRRCHATFLQAGSVTAFLMISYGILTGNSVSTRRAILMLFLALLADLFGRGYDLLTALGLAVLVLLAENPFLVTYSGFLFSVVAVLGIGVGLSVRTVRRAAGEKQRLVLLQSLEGLWISLVLQLFTLPLVAYFYYEIPVYALAVNVPVLGAVGPLLGLAVAGTLVGLFLTLPGRILLAPCAWLLRAYRWICETTAQLPGAQYICGRPQLWRIAVYYVLLAAVLAPAARPRFRMTRQRKAGMGAVVAFSLFLLLCPQKKTFEIDVLNVGQGDGIYLCTDDGVSLFLDGGSSDVSNVGTYRILPFLKYRGVKEISYWFVSHTDNDHISGLSEAIDAGYPIGHLVFARAIAEEENTLELAAQAQAAGIEVLYMEEGDVLRTKTGELRCLYPRAGEARSETNDLSLVLEFTDGERRALFAGDISEEIEQELLARGVCENVDFFKATHHGSKYANSAAFLERIAPQITVASAGENNLYGHPSPDAVERIRAAGSAFYCTATDGQVLWRGD